MRLRQKRRTPNTLTRANPAMNGIGLPAGADSGAAGSSAGTETIGVGVGEAWLTGAAIVSDTGVITAVGMSGEAAEDGTADCDEVGTGVDRTIDEAVGDNSIDDEVEGRVAGIAMPDVVGCALA